MQEAAELDLQREHHKLGHAKTVQELQSMISVLEKEAANNRGSASRRQALMAEAEKAKADLRAATARAEVFCCMVASNFV